MRRGVAAAEYPGEQKLVAAQVECGGNVAGELKLAPQLGSGRKVYRNPNQMSMSSTAQ